MKLNIIIQSIPDEIEKYILNNLELKAPNSYAEISTQELDNIILKTHKHFKNYKDIISEELIKSIKSSYMKNYIIMHNNNIYKNFKNIIKDYNNKINIIKICKKYDISPLNLLRQIFKYKYNKKISKLLKNNNELDKNDIKQLNIAKKYDIYASINQDEILNEANKFEEKIGNILKYYNIKFKTQKELSEEQTKTHGSPINTPDFLIESELYINNIKINWIDAKNFYGANTLFIIDKINNQTKKYIDNYGSGCIIFNLSFNSKLNFNKILLLDFESFSKILL